MPPTRRTSSTPSPKGRRPKIAGTGPAMPRRSPGSEDDTVDGVASSGTRPKESIGAAEPTESIGAAEPTESIGAVEPTESIGAVEPTRVDLTKPAASGVDETASVGSDGAGSTTDAASEDTTAAGPAPVEDDGTDAEGAVASEGHRVGWPLVAAVGAVAVALGAFAVVAGVVLAPGAEVTNRAWVDTSTTTEVAASARDAIQTLYTYKFDTVDADFAKARAMLTTDMQTQFDQTAQVTVDAVKQTKTATNAQVNDIGVKLLGDDTAELVASMNVSASNDGVAQGSAEGPLSVTMQKVDGTWLLAGIRDR